CHRLKRIATANAIILGHHFLPWIEKDADALSWVQSPTKVFFLHDFLIYLDRRFNLRKKLRFVNLFILYAIHAWFVWNPDLKTPRDHDLHQFLHQEGRLADERVLSFLNFGVHFCDRIAIIQLQSWSSPEWSSR
ncbi:unnamed protein product, partial [Ascophyllum nodosum]